MTACACGQPATVALTIDEAALFRHAGHGATRRTILELCPDCGDARTRTITEIAPATEGA